MATHDDYRASSLRDYIRWIRSRIWLVVAVTLVSAASAYLVSSSQTPMYEASARLMYQPPADLTNPSGSGLGSDSSTLEIQLQSVIDSIADPTVAARAEQALGNSNSGARAKVTANLYVPKDSSAGTSSSNLVEITAESPSATSAAALANAYAAAVIAVRKQLEQERLGAAQQVVENQLKLYTTQQSKLTVDYANLVQQLSNLQIAEATVTGDFRVVVPATAPSSPASPKPFQSAALGLGVGLLAGIGIAFLWGRLDTRLRAHREAADILSLPVLGRLPRLSRSSLSQGALVALSEPGGHFSEALRILRTNLEWASIDDPLSSLLITSSIKGEGKTLVVCNLAVFLARAGKRVVVVDADLRDPQVHRVFDLRNGVGLTSVALGMVQLHDALQVFKPKLAVTSSAGRISTAAPSPRSFAQTDAWCENLRVLTSGPLPPDPGEAVASRRLAATIKEIAGAGFDYVLVDSPPILSVGDAGAVSASVDALLMVVNLELVRRPTLFDSAEQLNMLPCRKVGLIAVGERIDHEEYYRYKTRAQTD